MPSDPAARSPRHTLPRAFWCAVVGLGVMFRDERNPRIQLACAIIAIGLGIWLKIDRMEWIAVVISISIVLSVEAVNTAIERAVDHTSMAKHPLAKQAKDIAAGAVLISSVGAAIVGAIILVPRLLSLVSR